MRQIVIMDKKEIIRYIINGLVATLVHYLVLTYNIHILKLDSAGISNLIAAIFGISISFLGSRYFVYKNHTGGFFKQGVSFFILYICIAFIHGGILYIWTDLYNFSYNYGFLIATFVQVSVSYIGNKILVFKK